MTINPYPRGPVARKKERAKIEALIAQLQAWQKSLEEESEEHAQTISRERMQTRHTDARAHRLEEAKGRLREADDAALQLRTASGALRNFLSNPITA